MKVKADTGDVERFRKDLKGFPVALNKAADKRLRDLTKVIAAEARRRAPRKTGRLAHGIRELQGNEIGVVSTVPYAGIFEFGGKHPVFGRKTAPVIQKPRPYLFPAIKANEDRIIAEAEKAITDAEEKTL